MASPSHPRDQLEAGLPLSDVRFKDVQELGTPAALSTGNTITHDGCNMVRVNPSGGAVTGIIIQDGFYHGQVLFVHNLASNSVTFAAASTSKVLNGASCVVPALCMSIFQWDATSGRWTGTESAP